MWSCECGPLTLNLVVLKFWNRMYYSYSFQQPTVQSGMCVHGHTGACLRTKVGPIFIRVSIVLADELRRAPALAL